jgi:hypothetical protein
MSCFAALTKRFGALTSAITSTTRKGLTLVLSYLCFPTDKSVTLGHVLGAMIFLGGLLMKSVQKHEPHPHHQPPQVDLESLEAGQERDGEWNSLPFGVKERRESEASGWRPVIVVAGSVHCEGEGEADGGIEGIGIEIETDDEGAQIFAATVAEVSDIEQPQPQHQVP